MAGGGFYPYDRGWAWIQLPNGGPYLVKPASGRLANLVVMNPTTTPVVCYDSASIGGIMSSNQFFASASAVPGGTIFVLDWPFNQGLVILVGSGGLISLSFS